MGSMSRSAVYFGIMAIILLSICGPARGADSSGNTDCISKITPCQLYLNTTGTPPNTCCSPLVDAYTNEKACLCRLLNDTELINAIKINITKAVQLPVRCGLDGNISSCSNLNSNTSSSSGSSPPPPSSKSALSSLSSFEILSLLALLLLGVAAQVYQ